VTAATAKALWDTQRHGGGLHALISLQFVLGVTLSAFTGCAVIAWLLHYLRHRGMQPFVYYRIVFGIIVLALAFIRRPA
jgi:undecaprenyl-diphosphatase